MLASATFALFTAWTAQATPRDFYLDQLGLEGIEQDWGRPHRNRSVDGNPLKIGGKSFARGIGSHANAIWEIELDGKAVEISAEVGVDDESGARGSVEFIIEVDGRPEAESGILKGDSPPKSLKADLRNARLVRLRVGDAGDGIDYDHADWGNLKIVTSGAAPKARGIESLPVEIAPVDLDKTEIHGAKVIGCTPGNDFLWRIPVTGKSPIAVQVRGLPRGLVYDASRRAIAGSVATEGTATVTITASGPGGRATRTVKIVAGEDKLAQTPPMGWNSWNVWGTDVDADKVRAAADSFVTEGLADFGYEYINIDDAWEDKRDASGILQPNAKFGSMSSLSAYVHSKGLKLGIYSSPGPKTCAGYEGSYRFEDIDAKTWAMWGIDYLKYDWCSYGGIDPRPDLAGYKLPYRKMKYSLNKAGRDIVYSLCQYGMGNVYEWGRSVGGNLWRTTGDIVDTWSSMAGIGFDHSRRSPFAGPGGWNDPDMLVVGYLGWSKNIRPTRLTPNEQVTHITLWSMLAAPLIIGCDLTKLDDFTKRLLCNHEVIDIDQDPLGKAAIKIWEKDRVEVWSRPLEGNGTAIAVFNRDRSNREVVLDFKQLGLPNVKSIRDVWKRKTIPTSNRLTLTVAAHGAHMFRIN